MTHTPTDRADAAPPSRADLIAPYGGRLLDLRVPADAAEEMRRRAAELPSLHLDRRLRCDLELLADGAFSPLDGFMNRADHERVVADMRLAAGVLFPIPVFLPVRREVRMTLDAEIALRDERNDILGVLTVEEVYRWDRRALAAGVAGTEDARHPFVATSRGWGEHAVSGRLQVLPRTSVEPLPELRLTPRETRDGLAALGRARVVAFQTRNPPHRGHELLMRRAIAATDGTLLLHPVVGVTAPGDVDGVTVARCCRIVAERHLPPGRVLLAIVPLAMRMVGPREALWHAIVRRNFGADHLVVGRHHASPAPRDGQAPCYDAFAARALAARHAPETGVTVVGFEETVYLPDEDRVDTVDRIATGRRIVSLSGSRLRAAFLDHGRRPPPWLVRPDVADVLATACPPRHRQGVCVWLTGLSASGKSTIAALVAARLEERGRRVTVLDGDEVRARLAPALGFSRADRDANVRAIGWIAAEVVRHGGVAVCAAVSPYRDTRAEVRARVGTACFVEVHVATSLDVCARRDVKGLYARALRGEVRGVAGIDDPYEPPEQPDIVLDAATQDRGACADTIADWLTRRGFVAAAGPASDGAPPQEDVTSA